MRVKTSIFVVLLSTAVLYLVGNEFGLNSVISDTGRQLAEIAAARHKNLFPIDNSDVWGTIFVIVGLLIAASGGIGGGGVLVPLLILVYGFAPKFAIPLSNFTIVGSSITNVLLNMPKRHPVANRPLVDWDLILVMEPLTMAGAIVGAILSKILPDWLLVISLVILLAVTTHRTLKKGISQFQKETKYFEDLKKSALSKALRTAEEEEHNDERTALLEEANAQQTEEEIIREKSEPLFSTAEAAPVDPIEAELAQLRREEEQTPWDKVRLISGMIMMVIVLNLLKGGGGAFPSPLGIACGSWQYWGVTALIFALIGVVTMWTRNILIAKWAQKRRLRYKYVEGDVEWTPMNTIKYPCICFFAGFFAGLFGVGGGIVKGPLMLEMGVNPLVASGTVAVMIMYTSVAATTMFMAFGTLTWDYAVFLFVVGLISTAVGQIGVGYLVKKYQRVSLISFSIGAVVALSTVLLGIQSVFSLVDAQNGRGSSSTLCGDA